jgi:hypothetical protein
VTWRLLIRLKGIAAKLSCMEAEESQAETGTPQSAVSRGSLSPRQAILSVRLDKTPPGNYIPKLFTTALGREGLYVAYNNCTCSVSFPSFLPRGVLFLPLTQEGHCTRL